MGDQRHASVTRLSRQIRTPDYPGRKILGMGPQRGDIFGNTSEVHETARALSGICVRFIPSFRTTLRCSPGSGRQSNAGDPVGCASRCALPRRGSVGNAGSEVERRVHRQGDATSRAHEAGTGLCGWMRNERQAAAADVPRRDSGSRDADEVTR